MLLKSIHLYITILTFTFLSACATFKKAESTQTHIKEDKTSSADKELVEIGPEEKTIYHPSETRANDIIHTALNVSFDWEKQYLFGEASITAKPYFYPTNTLELDAQGMDIHQIFLFTDTKDSLKQEQNLAYIYDGETLTITLDRTYSRNEYYSVFINYTAKPNELKKKGGSAAITDEKGLYFINPLGEEKEKPKQIWTQGEIQSSSVWFPTIDEPNERMTQEIYITVDEKYSTLSNGELVYSISNSNGTRTDYWDMRLPHAPYLAMMAIGEFSIVKDEWNGKDVFYYVEPEYEKYAKSIFGNTPEMLSFYSELLGVEYPWNKYSQVVVRDYVSGAMENTTAALFGEFMQRSDKELLDRNYERVVSHELFHEWFGDLVTCESWANIPLNESFATYGEYLWEEYKYGLDAAAYHSEKSRKGYLRESKGKQEDLIRFDYEKKSDMFDGHSYNKGGQILHMLRNYVGDDAFFSALKLYLNDNAYSSVEIHNLRLAFEKITGEDLNWFFNQWFLASGHPKLTFSSSYNATKKEQEVIVSQTQDLTTTPLYRLPFSIDIYENGTPKRHDIVVTQKTDTFQFAVNGKPNLVNIDADKMLLCEKEEKKSIEEWIFQYNHAPLYLDRKEALNGLLKYPTDSIANEAFTEGLKDKMWSIRSYTIKKLTQIENQTIKARLQKQLENIAKNDPKANVRKTAIDYLQKNYDDKTLVKLYTKSLKDSSYQVMCSAIMAIAETDSTEALRLATTLESEKNSDVLSMIAKIYALYGNKDNNKFYATSLYKFKQYAKLSYISAYTKFLTRLNEDELTTKGIALIKTIAEHEGEIPYIQKKATAAISDLEKTLSSETPSIK